MVCLIEVHLKPFCDKINNKRNALQKCNNGSNNNSIKADAYFNNY